MHKVFVANFDHSLVRADIITVEGSPVVAGFTKTGRVMVFSLPSLKLLMDAMLLPANDLRYIVGTKETFRVLVLPRFGRLLNFFFRS